MKNYFKVSILLLFFIQSFLYSQYWMKIQNLPSNFANNYWLDVYFHPLNPNYGWICGFNGMIIRTTDGGNTWQGSTVNAYHLESVHFPSLQVGYTSGVDGIFKSTDGGNTWFDVTPAGTRDTTYFWGCYFLNPDYGILVGDGCNGRYQHFWLTTDGGSSWSVFIAQEDNTGMTDAILYPNGIGYASSSGKIWITSDSGRTWRVFANVGPNLWQEEITNVGSSFLVPYSGTSCTGGGNDGGVKFTTNNGVTWQTLHTGVPMFGTFLLDNLKGWACGYNTEVYYTSNGGVTWQKRNCGIKTGNLDDLWFINENDGWVVGEGVYKLVAPKGEVSKNSLYFSETCVGDARYDTIWVTNYNFNDANINVSLSSGNNDFQIISPGSSAYIQSCDSVRVVIMFRPTSEGNKSGQLEIVYPNQNPLIVGLFGKAIEHSAKIIDSIIVIPRAKVGFSYNIQVKISVNTTNELVESIVPINDNPDFKLLTNLPFPLNSLTNNALQFEVLPRDTGWREITYKVNFSPCDTFQIIKIRVYGTSPIINVDSSFNIDFYCNTFPIYIPISNSGNDTLFIQKLLFSPANSNLQISGWTSGHSLNNNFILPGFSDTLIILINPGFLGTFSTNLIVENNDLRLLGNPRNNLRISINVRVFDANLSLSNSEIYYNEVCVGDTIWYKLFIRNEGNIDELVKFNQKNSSVFFVNKTQPFNCPYNDSVEIRIAFVPKQSGVFSDTIVFYGFNCNDTIKVICNGKAIKTKIICEPSTFNIRIQKGTTFLQTFRLFQSGADSIKNLQIHFFGDFSNLVESYNITGTILPNFTDTSEIQIVFKGKEKGRFSGQIVVTIDGVCDTVIIIPVNIEVIDKLLIIEPLEVVFNDIFCKPKTLVQLISIYNKSEIPDTIRNISLLQKFNQFKIENMPNLPIVINPMDSLELQISFTPILPGRDTALVLFEFDDTTSNKSIPLFGFFGYSKLILNKKYIDFGQMEYCQNPIVQKITILNYGNIDDSLIIAKPFKTLNFQSIVSKSKIIASNIDTIDLSIDFINPKEVGTYIDTLVIGLANCFQLDTIIVKATIVEPNFFITPEVIDLGEIWVGSSKSGSFEFTNANSFPLNISLFSDDLDSNLTIDFDTSFSLKGNEKTLLGFKINAYKVGEFYDTLCFKIMANCEYEKCVYIHYIIPEEEYSLTFKVGKYIAKPGDELTIEIENLTPTSLLKLDTLEMSLQFEQWLYYPVSCSTSDGDRIEINWLQNEVKFLFYNPILTKIINTGKTIQLNGKVLYSSPDSTALHLEINSFQPKKEINFSLIDGHLKVYPVCAPLGSMHLEIIPTFELLGVILEDNSYSIVVYSDYRQIVDLHLFDILGNLKGVARNFELESGKNFIKVNNIFEHFNESFIVVSNGLLRKIIYIPPF